MKIEIIRGQNASQLLTDAEFCAQWTTLCDGCAWATAMQSLPFAQSWYECYESEFETLLVTARDAENALIGLLPLAISRGDNSLTFAGGAMCEYAAWLAVETVKNEFIESALDELKRQFPKGVLSFNFLAAGAPLDWAAKGKWRGKCDLRTIERPLLRLDETELTATMRKKHHRSRWNQMTKRGAAEFVRVTESNELAAIFDDVRAMADLRLSAVHGDSFPVDPHKNKFYQMLLERDLLHATLLKVGGEIASAQFNIRSRDQIMLGLTALSPFFAAFSPNKFHILLLGLESLKENVPTLDLTPGGTGYKEKHANDADEVHVLTVRFDGAARARFKFKRRVIEIIKKGLAVGSIDRDGLAAKIKLFRHKLQFMTVPKTVAKIASKLPFKKSSKLEMRVYTMDAADIGAIPTADIMRRNCLSDLLCYEPTEAWQMTPSEFHREAIHRLGNNCHVYTKIENARLVHCGWLGERQTVSRISEVDQTLELPPDSVVLFDFFTHSAARGRGFYQSALRQMLHDAVNISKAQQIFITVAADNLASRHSIEKIGFKHFRSLFQR